MIGGKGNYTETGNKSSTRSIDIQAFRDELSGPYPERNEEQMKQSLSNIPQVSCYNEYGHELAGTISRVQTGACTQL